MAKLEHWQLKQRQGQPLDIKERLTANRIRAYYERLGGNVYYRLRTKEVQNESYT